MRLLTNGYLIQSIMIVVYKLCLQINLNQKETMKRHRKSFGKVD